MYAVFYEKIPLSELLVDKFREIYATIRSLKEIGFKDRNFREFSPGNEVPKNYFGTEVAKVAA